MKLERPTAAATGLLSQPAELRKQLAQLEKKRRAMQADGRLLDALAEGCFRLSVHPSTSAREAIDLLLRALNYDGSNPRYAYHLGRVYLRHGRLDRAKTWLKKAADLCPTSHRIWSHITLLQRELNEHHRNHNEYLPGDLKKRARKLAEEVRAGTDQVKESHLSMTPRLANTGQGGDSSVEKESGGTVPAPPQEARPRPVSRILGAKTCRWSGVVDLLAEDSFEADPNPREGSTLRGLLQEADEMVASRKGGYAALAVLGVEWLIRGYPSGFVRGLLKQRSSSENLPSLQLLEHCCRVFEVSADDLPRILSQALERDELPPLLTAMVHYRRLLWKVPTLDRLGAVVRACRRFLEQSRRDGDSPDRQDDKLLEKAGEFLELLQRNAGELDAEPPATVDELPPEREAPALAAESGPEVLAALERASGEMEKLRGQAYQFLKQTLVPLAESSGNGDEERRRVAADRRAIGTFVKGLKGAVAAGLKKREALKQSVSKSEKTTIPDFIERSRECGATLKKLKNLGNFNQQLERVDRALGGMQERQSSPEGQPSDQAAELLAALRAISPAGDRQADDETEADAGSAGGPAEPAPVAVEPEDPFTRLEVRLAEIERRARDLLAEARTTFDCYGDHLFRYPPLAALRSWVDAREAEILYRMGHHREARRIWVRLSVSDPLNPDVLKNLAVCDTANRNLGRQLESWRSYVEVLYFLDVVAGNPRPLARDRARFHHDFAGAYAPTFASGGLNDPKNADERELKAFLGSPRLRIFVGHTLLECLNARLDYTSPAIILGVDRSAGEQALEAARDGMFRFLDSTSRLLPGRIRAAFSDLAENRVAEAFEATKSAKRLTLTRDPRYSPEKKRYFKWLTEIVLFKLNLFLLGREHMDKLLELPSLDGFAELERLDAVPIGNSPDFLRQVCRSREVAQIVGENWELVIELMARLKREVILHAGNSRQLLKAKSLIPSELDRADCPSPIVQLTINCGMELIEKLKEKIGAEAVAEAIDHRLSGQLAGGERCSDFSELEEAEELFAAAEEWLSKTRSRLEEESEEPKSESEEVSLEDVERLEQHLNNTLTGIYMGPAMERYQAIMERARKGIDSAENADEIAAELASLQEEVERVGERLGTGEPHRDLLEAIEGSLRQVRKIQRQAAEAELLNDATKRFNLLMETAKGGFSSPTDQSRFRNAMSRLGDSVDGLLTSVESSEGKKAVENLRSAIDNVLSQIPT